MNSIIIRFASNYSPEFMERLKIGSIAGNLTHEEIKRAHTLWNLCDFMVSDGLLILKSLSMAVHVASLDEETGYFEPEHGQHLSLFMVNQLEKINDLKAIGDDALSAVTAYEKQQLIEGVAHA